MASIPSWCRKGAQVVCVDDRGDRFVHLYPGHNVSDDLDGLQRGCIYTVRGVGFYHLDRSPTIFLEEIVRPLAEGDPEEVGFSIQRFRPLISKDQDLELFKHLLTPIHDLSDETLAGELALDAANGRHT